MRKKEGTARARLALPREDAAQALCGMDSTSEKSAGVFGKGVMILRKNRNPDSAWHFYTGAPFR
jgi:hypothetical protein